MLAHTVRHRHAYADFVRFESTSNVKHEFLEGEIYAIAGGTREHALYAANLAASLHAQLRGRPCAVHSSDLRVRVLATGLATYPDVSIVCGVAEFDPDDGQAVTNPKVLIEVLSPGTAEWDRGEKLSHYKRIASLHEVVLVSHDQRLVEVHQRQGSEWVASEAREGRIELASIRCTLDVNEVYWDPLAAP